MSSAFHIIPQKTGCGGKPQILVSDVQPHRTGIGRKMIENPDGPCHRIHLAETVPLAGDIPQIISPRTHTETFDIISFEKPLPVYIQAAQLPVTADLHAIDIVTVRDQIHLVVAVDADSVDVCQFCSIILLDRHP